MYTLFATMEDPSMIVRVNSEEMQAISGMNSSNFRTQFNNSSDLANINRVVIKQISIPNVQYNIKTATSAHAATNVFTFNDGILRTITIPVGYYNINQVITAITSNALAVADNLAITLNATTGHLQFTSTIPITYLSLASGNGMAPVLGILTDSGSVTTYSATGLPNLFIHPNIYVASIALSDGSHMVSPTLGSLPVCAVVPINVSYGNMIQYTAVQEHLDDIHYTSYMNGKSLQTIDFQLYDGDANFLDLQGLNWTIVFKAYQTPP